MGEARRLSRCDSCPLGRQTGRRGFLRLLGGALAGVVAACASVHQKLTPGTAAKDSSNLGVVAPTAFEMEAGSRAAEAAAASNACEGEFRDVGPTAAFEAISAAYLEKERLFVIRDKKGLYAIHAVCTHERCNLKLVGDEIRCKCHGSRFALDGTVTAGPAPSRLRHYRLCHLTGGRLGVERTRVSPSTRL